MECHCPRPFGYISYHWFTKATHTAYSTQFMRNGTHFSIRLRSMIDFSSTAKPVDFNQSQRCKPTTPHKPLTPQHRLHPAQLCRFSRTQEHERTPQERTNNHCRAFSFWQVTYHTPTKNQEKINSNQKYFASSISTLANQNHA